MIRGRQTRRDRKSTRLNSSHPSISYAVFCLKKKKKLTRTKIHDATTLNQSLFPRRLSPSLMVPEQSRFCGAFRTRIFFFFNDTATTEIYTLSLHDALPI